MSVRDPYHRTLGLVGLAFGAIAVGGCLEPESNFRDPGTDGGSFTTGAGTTGSVSTTADPATTEDPSGGGTTQGDACGEAGCACEAGSCDEGLVCDEVCILVECGDERIEGDEECDDGNTVDADGCNADCTRTSIKIRSGFDRTCALIGGSQTAGRVRCWGSGARGQLGYGNLDTIGDDEHPFEAGDVTFGFAPADLEVGDFHACVMHPELPEVHCWGRNNLGQLGYANTEDIGDDELPSAVGGVTMGFPVQAMTVGGSHSCAVSTGDQVRCWGWGFAGRLGYGSTDDIGDDERPDAVGPVQPGAAVVSLVASVNHTCAILIDDGLRCWGDGSSGGLGYGSSENIGDDELPLTTDSLQFASTPVQLAGGLDHMCALLEDGTVRCWGSGTDGQHGGGMTDDLGDDERADTLPPVNFGGARVTALTAGDRHTCAILDSGDVRCWGGNTFGQLGRGHVETIGDDETPAAEPAISFDSPAISIDAGGDHTCAVLEDTSVYCWGSNLDAELGLPGRPLDDHVGDDELPTTVDPVRILQ